MLLICIFMTIPSKSDSSLPTSAFASSSCSSSSSEKEIRISNVQDVQYPFWIHFFSGGIAGSVSAVITCPLELVKTRFQSSQYYTENVKWSFRKNLFRATFGHVSTTLGALRYFAIFISRLIYLNEGFFSLWKGVGATLVGVMPSRAIYFSSYQTCKTHFSQFFSNGIESAPIHIVSAISAGMHVSFSFSMLGIVTTTATNPIWLVKTRIQLQSTPKIYKNSFDCLRKIVRNEGPLALYQGMTASYLGCVEGAIQWVLYEKLKAFFKEKSKASSESGSGKAAFFAAAISKVVACSLTYPHEVLRTRLRQGVVGTPTQIKAPYKGLVSTIRRIYTEEGIAPFYGGMTAHLLRVVPNAAIMFLCYELLVSSISYKYGCKENFASSEKEELKAV